MKSYWLFTMNIDKIISDAFDPTKVLNAKTDQQKSVRLKPEKQFGHAMQIPLR